MRVLISIEHPAWSWQFKKIIKQIASEGDILVLAVKKDGDTELLDDFGISYKCLAGTTGKNVLEKAYLFLKLCVQYTLEARKFKPDIMIGRASPMMAIAAFICGKPHIFYEDTEVSKFSLRICRVLSTLILTPENFLSDLGKKQLRVKMYKELFYLHEQEFQPDKKVLLENGINPDERFAVVRFIAWNASHDVGLKGLNDDGKIEFIRNLSKEIKVYISSEGNLPKELEQYRLKTPFNAIHNVLYYATLVISEGGTTASEAVVLGTHAILLNEIKCGTFIEQEEKYELMYIFRNPSSRYKEAILKAKDLLKNSDLWDEGKKKRNRIMQDMGNPNDAYMNYVRMNVEGKEKKLHEKNIDSWS